MTSHLSDGVLCLYPPRALVDNLGMETTLQIPEYTCHMCDKPALTFDEAGVALCGRHATVFMALKRVESKVDEHLKPTVVKASA